MRFTGKQRFPNIQQLIFIRNTLMGITGLLDKIETLDNLNYIPQSRYRKIRLVYISKNGIWPFGMKKWVILVVIFLLTNA